MAKNGAKGKQPAKLKRVSPLKPGLRGASRLVQSRVHAGLRSATLSRSSMLRFTGSVAFTFLALVLLALWLGGHMSTVQSSISDFKRDRLMAMGFTIERIDVTGEGRLNEADVRAAVGIYEGDYFFGADLKRAQRNTESLPWVDRAVVRRLWPDRIVVQLVETTPYALYQKDGVLHLAAQDGTLIAPFDPKIDRVTDSMRVFIGDNPVAHAGEVTEDLKSFEQLWNETDALTRHSSGRWDLTLAGGTLVKLPKENLFPALSRVSALAKTTDLSRFAIIDLRLSDRMTLTPMTEKKLAASEQVVAGA